MFTKLKIDVFNKLCSSMKSEEILGGNILDMKVILMVGDSNYGVFYLVQENRVIERIDVVDADNL